MTVASRFSDGIGNPWVQREQFPLDGGALFAWNPWLDYVERIRSIYWEKYVKYPMLIYAI